MTIRTADNSRPLVPIVARLLIAAGAVLLVVLGFEMFPIVPYLMQPIPVVRVGLVLGYALLAVAFVVLAEWSAWLPLRIACVLTALGWMSLIYWIVADEPDPSPFNTGAMVLIVVGSLASGVLIVLRRVLPRPIGLVFLVTMVATVVDVFWAQYPLWLENVADFLHFGLLMAVGILLLRSRPLAERTSRVAPYLVGGLFVLEGLALFAYQLGIYLEDAVTHAFEAGKGSIQDANEWIPLAIGAFALFTAALAVAFVLLALRPVGVITRVAFIVVALHATLELFAFTSAIDQQLVAPVIAAVIAIVFVLGSLTSGVLVVVRRLFRLVPSVFFLVTMVAVSADAILGWLANDTRPGGTHGFIPLTEAALFLLCGIALLIWPRTRSTATE